MFNLLSRVVLQEINVRFRNSYGPNAHIRERNAKLVPVGIVVFNRESVGVN